MGTLHDSLTIIYIAGRFGWGWCVLYTLWVLTVHSLAILECHSYSPRPSSHIFLRLLIYLCTPPLVFALTFPGPLQRPRSCIAGPRGRQFPSCVLQARQIFSTSLPPTQSLPLAFCVHFHVGPSLWRQPVPQPVWVICYIFSPSSPLQALGCKTAFEWDVLWLREKKGTTQIIFPEKVNSLSRVSKYSTGVRVSHPTVWLLTLCCGMLLMSHSSRLDWSVHSLSHDSPLRPYPAELLNPAI